MRKIVVTGATGHLGQQVVRQLAMAGRDVRAVGVEPVDQDFAVLTGLPVERVQADVRDLDQVTDALRGADVVLDLASRVSIAAGDDLLGPIDASGVANVLEACRSHAVDRLVHVSSVAALIPDGPCGPPLQDGHSTARGDALVREAITEGMDAVIVYPTGILGPGDPGRGHLNRLLLDVWQRRQPATVGGGFDWVDVRDVATGIVAAMAIAPVGGRYVLSGHWHTIEELVARAAEIGGVRQPVDRRPLRLTRDSIDTLDHDDVFDPARARCDLGYLPRPLDATLRDTYAWFVGQGLVRPVTERQLVPA